MKKFFLKKLCDWCSKKFLAVKILLSGFFKWNPATLAFLGAIALSVGVELLLNIPELRSNKDEKMGAVIIIIISALILSVFLLFCQNKASTLQENYSKWVELRKTNEGLKSDWVAFLQACNRKKQGGKNEPEYVISCSITELSLLVVFVLTFTLIFLGALVYYII